MQEYKEVAGGGLNAALPQPPPAGGPSQLDTSNGLTPSFIHPFLWPKAVC